MNLSKNVKVVGSSLGVMASASTTINSHWVDTQGFNGCMFIAKASTLAGAVGTHTVTAYHCTSASTGSMGAIGTVTSTAHLAGAGTNRIFTFDIYKPTKRYCRISHTGSSAGTYEHIAVLYEPKRPGSSACCPASSTTWAASTRVSGKTT